MCVVLTENEKEKENKNESDGVDTDMDQFIGSDDSPQDQPFVVA